VLESYKLMCVERTSWGGVSVGSVGTVVDLLRANRGVEFWRRWCA